MEAVPRLPMVSFQLKVSPEPTSFSTKLKQYIRDFYNEDAESYNNELHQLESLRSSAVRPPIDVKGCELLKRYYCQLHFLQSRFPMGKDGPAAVVFTWKDTYANMVCSLANIRFEMISVLYNISAIHTQLGARSERTSPEGMKMACTHFQCAAWAFDHLKNSYPQPPGVDLAPELMTFMYQLCLAQGQECILEKSMLDNRKPSIVAKVARQIVDYYGLALATLEQGGNEDGTVGETVGNKIYKIWKRYVKFKRAYHLAVTQLYQGLAAEEQRKMGERVAFYNSSLTALNEARSFFASAKGVNGITGTTDEKEAIEEALTFTNDVIEGKRKAAKNENEYIYHEEVPEKDALPTVKGASLVKGISFNVNDPEVSGSDIFARLVPMKVHEANSLYSEEKAKVLRSVGGKIEERDQILNTYLMSLKLENLSLWDPDAVNSESEVLALPEELAERCAAINAKPNAIQEQVDTMAKLSDTYQNVEAMLKEIDVILSTEQQREKQYQETMGKRPPSIVATDLTREAKKYEEAHAKASESNQALHRAMNLHVNNLKILSQPLSSLMAHIPSPTVKSLGEGSSEKKIDTESENIRTRELKRILNKVDEMRRQRNELHTKLRDAISQDDLTRILVTATSESESSLDQVFAEQISKHQPTVSLIEQNLAAQDNILSALTEAYAHTAEIRKTVEEVLKRREYIISSLITSYDAYEDLLSKTTKGLEFYRKMEINVTKLLQRVKNTCKVQEEERAQIISQNSAGLHGINDISIVEAKSTLNMIPKDPSATGSGLKLKDYLANRGTNIPVYHNQYSDQRTLSTTKLSTDQPGIKTSDHQNGAHENMPSTAVPQFTDPNQAYQYYQNMYSEYYPGQHNTYNTQYVYGETSNNTSNNLNSSLPKTGTTFSDSVYGQAGKIKASTESTNSSDSSYGAYIPQKGYSTNPVNDQYSNYTYNAGYPYGYQVLPENASYPVMQQQINSPSPHHQQQNLTPMQLQSTQQVIVDEAGRSIEVNQSVPYVTSIHQSYNTDGKANSGTVSQVQTNNQNVPINSYQVGISQTNLQQTNTLTQNYLNPLASNVEMPASVIMSQSNQSIQQHSSQVDLQQPISLQQINQISAPQQIISQQNTQMMINQQTIGQQAINQQQVNQQPINQQINQQPINQHQVSQQPINQQQINQQPVNTHQINQQVINQQQSVNPQTQLVQNPQSSSPGIHYSLSQQYIPNQHMGMYTNTSATDSSTYSTATTKNPSVNISSNSYYDGAAQYSNYGSDQQQNYMNNQSQVGGYVSQNQNEMTHNYNTYGNYQQPDSTTYNKNPQNSATIQNIPGYSEIIQSHAKANSFSNYQTNYYNPQEHYSGSSQYSNYSQNYGNNYGNVQQSNEMSNSSTDSYQGHPGYVYNSLTGGYEYSSGYQNTQTLQGQEQQNNVAGGLTESINSPVYQQQDGYMLYTNAGNNTATNQTSSSQYSGQNDNSTSNNPAYYSSSSSSSQYTQQTSTQSNSNVTYNETQIKSQTIEKNTVNNKPPASMGPKSNVDLLSDLDITINHAPLLPAVPLKDEKEEVKNELKTFDGTPEKVPLTRKDSKLSMDDKNENLQIVWDTWYLDVQPKKDPLGEPTILQKFLIDIEKYEKFVDSLLVITLSGAKNIDIKWKEVKEFEDREAKKQSSTVALANSATNRNIDCIPYDTNRVEMHSYINASFVKDVTQWTPAAFIITQAPRIDEFQTFWIMVWDQEAEVIACLASDLQLSGDVYWPTSEEKNLVFGDITLKMKNRFNHATYIQTIISLSRSGQKMERVVVHMQFLVWPTNGFPSSPGSLLAFATDVMSEQALRHCSPKPIIVHCLVGGTLSGLFLIAMAAICNVRAGHGIVDVPLVFSSLVKFRKGLVDKDSLLFGYRMVLYHAQDTLMKRGILSSTRSTFECFEEIKKNKGKSMTKTRHHPSDDFLHNFGSGIQHGGQPTSSARPNTPQSIPSISQEKSDVVIDPLSQLDPLWTIRR
ncbi:tyrosine-protein phosphatase non-receptor type 23 isoform X2 [Leptopilina boulardi]|uniref:tyrosine-protein phosphatase non-receptor type 23 isoform X2 n=1 Tax=Leptopilina boulardi TaxID=63433 RepID=UPI0021F5E2C8|nr:tyrosine-protein phosphatase non-receptor type 23 isoform X2 [Leptopilina boulardi]